ncbi:MAG: diphosphomevalonate decarboxylase [Saprospiraceae bacterium]
MKKLDFISNIDKGRISESSGVTSWLSPSNLAIVKYWGKYDQQLPRNPSISITLSKAVTNTAIKYKIDPRRSNMKLDFLFENKENPTFKVRVEKFLMSIQEYFPFIQYSHLMIDSKNSFPHSSGIASSASSMSALALCLCDIERSIVPSAKICEDNYFFKKSSFIARLGSGSASRSVYPHFALWGHVKGDAQSSDLYAIEVKEYHPIFNTLRNDILIVNTDQKSVSSTLGHKLMENNPYAATRYAQAIERTLELKHILKNGDLEDFGALLESEALTLHALMMASHPSFLLIEPNTINVINEIRSFRKDTGIPVYFSLDAGPNMHIISFEKDRDKINTLLEHLRRYAVSGKILNDRIGIGAVKENNRKSGG